jgi:pyridoxine 4-dehydrogenase
MATATDTPAAAGGTFTLGDDLTVRRMGYGAMRITGRGIWGPPKSHDDAIRVLQRAVEFGVDFIDTADSYGPFYSEDLIAEALAPYEGVTIATKGGLLRTGPDKWPVLGKPDYLRQAVQMSLRRLKLDQIPLYQLHRIDPEVPREEQFKALQSFVKEGWVKHVGLSEVGVEEIEAAREVLPIVSVQNQYNLGDRKHEAVLDYCEKEGIAFIPWFPLDGGKLSGEGGVLDNAAKELEATPSQVALAWLLKRSPCILLIPGTSSVEHLEENVAAASLELPDTLFEQLSEAAA